MAIKCGKSGGLSSLGGIKDGLKGQLKDLATLPIGGAKDALSGIKGQADALKNQALSAIPKLPALPDVKDALIDLAAGPTIGALKGIAGDFGVAAAGIGLALLKGQSIDVCAIKPPGLPAPPSSLPTVIPKKVEALKGTIKGATTVPNIALVPPVAASTDAVKSLTGNLPSIQVPELPKPPEIPQASIPGLEIPDVSKFI